MNFKQIFFSGVVCAGVGSVIGLGVLQIAPSPYQSRDYRILNHNYPLIGALAGFLGGGVIAAIQQLHNEYDRRER